ncbi:MULTISPECIES: RNA 2',3'-cyclic phosphodiesterase [Methylobacterium]|uniref:RNA 2',3'-cyclic phosphodiesterase n=1 Tax=Methylobacterium jeotgali TaxID=381630 RepID=A0ABQ4SSW5_9HYPH|nr:MULTISPECIES: RNA 2',3'-cyclic phosphodiesterase [Methylobacterium]PIU05226.1 MAG: RNA 2',3'-cyclic phosphodiesterase [Methylobacterium sp. CG09_land_8_20_14_0_10_71_15]PIU15477.1 MAG: RNA 2',3'-cyclic phosphodiesterase [Methylobacterium sp. CG08_land_8_20_14_0_20_71_15]GBU19518.1 RNA 2',3'-cyclic phosphodiesterase [Methylobacterium sp.]GJE06317.1 RNA 2',3'-cyclic phosphodiesterase [Methylobacterium jeotgali]
MPRLFTALAVPEAIGQTLALHRGGLPGARWIEPGDYHVTLRFLGDVSLDLAEDLCAALAEARPRPPVEITLDGLASFGGDRPRAVFAAVAASPDLLDLQAEQERLARRAGAEPERRRFTPHVTLARLNRSARPEDVAMFLSGTALAPVRFTAREVVLFSARASTGGGPYVAEAVFPFA